MPDLAERARKFILEKGMPPRGERILLGVSGGVDSMVMAHVLKALGYHCSILHVDYQLRGEASAGDAKLVQETAERWGMECRIVQIEEAGWEQYPGSSLQMAAREIRYSLFEEALTTSGIPWCAMAHHQDDLAESFLLSILRGGKGGELQGIPPVRKPFFRPLWFATKSEIREYAQEYEVPYREDATNWESKYLRNVVRNKVFPSMETIHPQPAQRWVEWGMEVQKQQSLYRKMVKNLIEPHLFNQSGITGISWGPLQEQFGDDFPTLLKAALMEWGFTGNHAHEIAELAGSPKGKIWKGAGRIVARTDKGIEWGTEADLPNPEECIVIPDDAAIGQEAISLGKNKVMLTVHQGGEAGWEPMGNNEFVLDLDQVAFPLTLRHWKEGDRMRPLGLGGTKKLKEIFADAKSSYFGKMQAIVFEDARQIICLSGYRISEEVAFGPQTTQVLRIKIEEG